MNKQQALAELLDRAFMAGVAEYQICEMVGSKPQLLVRWKKNPDMMSARKFKQMRDALVAYEKEIENV